MATTEEVQKLAALARIKVDGADLEKFAREFDAILAYVGQLEKLELPQDGKEEVSLLRNVMRNDGEPYPAGTHTKKIVEQFPASEKNALVVKQIITHE